MDYYFKIANCIIKISSPFEIFWNKYINKFSCNKTDNIDEYYKLQVVDELKPMGKQIYNDGNQIIFKSDNFKGFILFSTHHMYKLFSYTPRIASVS